MRIREAQGADAPEQREVPTAETHLPEAEQDAQAALAEAIIQKEVLPAVGAVQETGGGARALTLTL